jgi:hypothetical protein
VFFIVEGLTRHDGFWAKSVRNSALHREEVEQLNGMEHNVDHQNLGDPLKWKAVASCSAPFLYHPDSTFDFRDMLVSASQVDHRATGHRINQSRERGKLPIRMHRCDAETTMEVVLVYLLECFENLRNSSVRKMIDRREANFATQRQEERNLVDKENIECQENLSVKFQQLRRDLYKVLCHRAGFAPSGLPFQCGDVLPPNLEGNVDILDRHWTVLDLVAPNHPLKILPGRVTEHGVQSSGKLCTLDLSLRETFLVPGDSINENKRFISWIVVVKSAFVHPKLHVRLAL